MTTDGRMQDAQAQPQAQASANRALPLPSPRLLQQLLLRLLPLC